MVGEADGASVGVEEAGADVGAALGAEVAGAAVGAELVGAALGAEVVGSAVGAAVVGDADTEGVGALVGDAVVMQIVQPEPCTLPSDVQVKLNPAATATLETLRAVLPGEHSPPQAQYFLAPICK